jgi:hypothetical protein
MFAPKRPVGDGQVARARLLGHVENHDPGVGGTDAGLPGKVRVKGGNSVVPLADRAIGNQQQLLIVPLPIHPCFTIGLF